MVEIVGDGRDIFMVVDGIRVAKRDALSRTWFTLVEGWTVISHGDHNEIEILHDGRSIN
jgi:hypothetical protein